MLNKTISGGKIFLVFSLAVFFLFGAINFAKKDVLAAESDAVAVRVLPNPHHYSPLAWYQDKKFSGTPTPLKVDGYEAIQDGRTVYVNVANVVGGAVYTNIYLISYNQNATPETISIFNRVLEKWKFNTNLTETGTCFYQANTTQVCRRDTDCTGSGFCSSLKARITRDTKRLADILDFRLQLEKYNEQQGHFPLLSAGTYVTGKTISVWPSWSGELAAELGWSLPVDPINKLGDCGGPQYDPVTCWDDKTKSFAGPFPTPDGLPPNSRIYIYSTDVIGKNYTACAEMESGLLIGDDDGACLGSYSDIPAPTISCGSLIGVQGQPFAGYITVTGAQEGPMLISIPDLPAAFNIITDSNAPVYSSDPQCQAYFAKIIDAIVPARISIGGNLRQITGSYWSAGPCYPLAFPPGNAAQCEANRASNMSAFGFTSADFGGASFIFDENEGERGVNPVDYCVPDTIILNNCPGNVECGSASINCGSANTPFFNSKCNSVASSNAIISKATIVSSNAATGIYPITISLENNAGVVTTKNCSLNVSGNASLIYPVANQRVHAGKQLNFSVYGYTSTKNYDGISFSFVNVYTAPFSLSCASITPLKDGRVRCDVNFSYNEAYNGDITVSASVGGNDFTSQTFNLDNFNNPPVMDPSKCPKEIRVNDNYACRLTAKDPDGDNIVSITPLDPLPAGMNFIESSGLMGAMFGNLTEVGEYNIRFVATDEYNGVSEPLTLSFKVNSYCGDGTKQSPNTEGKGANDGYENCDCGGYENYFACAAAGAVTGVPLGTSQSSVIWQYGCNADCSFLKGGFCGDQVAQDGEYDLFKATLGKETAAGIEMVHTRTDYTEQCDDGNDINGDGCNTFNASGNPSCQWVCGDGVLSDGRYSSFAKGVETHSYILWGDISTYHSRDVSLNGASQPEQCDDGNAIDRDGCNTFSANCQHVCGDGHLDAGERCEVEVNGADTAENLDGKTCQDNMGPISGRPWEGGALHCTASSCEFDTGHCVYYDDVSGHVGQALNGSDASGVLVSIVYDGVTYSGTSGGDGKFTIPKVPHRAPTTHTITTSGGDCAFANRGMSGNTSCLGTTETTVMNGPVTGLDFYVFPDDWTGQYAFVLSWNGPTDLDAHLTFGSTHISYQARGPSSGASLDWDDLSNNGHEVISIASWPVGQTYLLYVHNYGHQFKGGPVFNSSVSLKYFNRTGSGTYLLGQNNYLCPNTAQNYWEALAFTSSAGTILPITQGNSCGDGTTVTISGTVTNALTGDVIPGATASIEYGNKEGLVYSAVSDSAGAFTIADIPNRDAMNATKKMTITAPGFKDTFEDLNLSVSGPSKAYYLFPDSWTGNLAIVLNWNVPPLDLDAHLKFYNCNISYLIKGVVCNGLMLDRDDQNITGLTPPDNDLTKGQETISRYGNEVIAGGEPNNLHTYYVDNYTGGNFPTSAIVRMFLLNAGKAQLVRECKAESRTEKYWTVFKYYDNFYEPSNDFYGLTGLDSIACQNIYSATAP